MRRASCFAAALVCLLSACDTVPEKKGDTAGAAQSAGSGSAGIMDRLDAPPSVGYVLGNQSQLARTPAPPVAQDPAVRFDVTPFSDFSQNTPRPSALAYAGTYTRFEIKGALNEAAASAPGDTNYGYSDPRGLFAKFMLGLKYDTNFSVQLRAGTYEETVSLLTLVATSDRNGSSWSRDVSHNAFNFPWFLVTPTSGAFVPSIAPRVRVASLMSSGVAAAALKTTLRAVETLSPQSNVVTTLSAAAARNRADAIDEILSRLFATQIEEAQRSDLDVKWWHSQAGATIKLRIPKDPSNPGGDPVEVGNWTVKFAPPRVSLFSEYRLCSAGLDEFCKPTYNDAAAEAYKAFPPVILGFNIRPGLTIRKWVEQESWWAATRDRFTGVPENDQEVASELCATMSVTLNALGLNTIDSDLVIWSMLQLSPRPPRSEKKPVKYWEAPICREIGERVSGEKKANVR